MNDFVLMGYRLQPSMPPDACHHHPGQVITIVWVVSLTHAQTAQPATRVVRSPQVTHRKSYHLLHDDIPLLEADGEESVYHQREKVVGVYGGLQVSRTICFFSNLAR